MRDKELLQKMASDRAVLADKIAHWALPKERRFPLDSPGFVKMAADEFEHQDMSPSQRLVASRAICARAQELGVDVESSLARKYACANLSDHFSTYLGLRKEASAHLHDPELDKLLEVAQVINSESDDKERVKGLDKVAWALEDFDRRNDLAGHWGHWFPDPAYSTYGLTLDPAEFVETQVKVAGDLTVNRQGLDDADWSLVQGKLPDEVVDGMKNADDKLAVFESLPDPEKEIIYQSLFTA